MQQLSVMCNPLLELRLKKKAIKNIIEQLRKFEYDYIR